MLYVQEQIWHILQLQGPHGAPFQDFSFIVVPSIQLRSMIFSQLDIQLTSLGVFNIF